MFLPVDIYKKTLRILGFIFICVGLLFGYTALQAILDPNVTINLNGIVRKGIEAKMANLILPIIFVLIGLLLCLAKGETLANVHKIRESFWSIFHVK
jgi:hypothetical protein